MSLGAETGSLTFGFLGTCVLKENGTICQLSFQYPRGKLHSEIAHPIPGGNTFLLLQMSSCEVGA